MNLHSDIHPNLQFGFENRKKISNFKPIVIYKDIRGLLKLKTFVMVSLSCRYRLNLDQRGVLGRNLDN